VSFRTPGVISGETAPGPCCATGLAPAPIGERAAEGCDGAAVAAHPARAVTRARIASGDRNSTSTGYARRCREAGSVASVKNDL
jgi:hypothetical protein